MALWHIHIHISGQRSGRKKEVSGNLRTPIHNLLLFQRAATRRSCIRRQAGSKGGQAGCLVLKWLLGWGLLPCSLGTSHHLQKPHPRSKEGLRGRVEAFKWSALYDHFPKCQSAQINRASRGITLKSTDAPWNRGDASLCIAQRIYLDVYKRSMHKWLIWASPLGYEGNPATLIHLPPEWVIGTKSSRFKFWGPIIGK